MLGQTVSHYLILQKIGSGGMGEIYLAEDTKLERRVALKFLPRHMTADPEARTRFEREAKAAAALNHPNIVTIHGIGEHEGQVFIAMEYVEGRTLKELISDSVGAIHESPLPFTQVLDIAGQIAQGLAAAHARGIVHRDIKPQNIVVGPDGRAKILDFGLAKLKGASPLTKESSAYGTVHYMSPEQGLGREVDARSDIWSLGVVLYEMLAGTPPFHGEYEQAVIYAIINEETPPLPEAVRLECPGLEDVVRRCLAKKRQERFPTTDALAAALLELHGGKLARTPKRNSRSRSPRRTFLTAISLMLLSGLLGFLALSPKTRTALGKTLGLAGIPRERHLAVLPITATNDEEATALGDGFTAVIIDKLTWLEKFHDTLWTYPADTVFLNRAHTPREMQSLLGCNLFISGDLRLEKNSLHLRLFLQDAKSGRRLRQVEMQGNIANLTLFQNGLIARILKLLGLPEQEDAQAYVNSGGTSLPGAFILYLKGKGALQEPRDRAKVSRATAALEKALGQDDRFVLARLALLDAWRSRPREDPERWLKAEGQWAVIRQTAGRWAPAWLTWGRLLEENARSEEAQAAFRNALELDGHCYEAQVRLARSRADAGASTEAERLFKKAIELRPGYPRALEELAYFCHLHGRFDEALALYGRISHMTPGDPQVFCNLGAMHLIKGNKSLARTMFERSYAIEPSSTARSNLALIYYYDGDYRRALPLHEEAARGSSEHYEWGNLADTFRQLPGCQDKADAAYRKAIALADKALAAGPENPAEVLSSRALYYAHLGEKQKALAAIARARALAPAFLPGIQRAILVFEASRERPLALAALRDYLERLGSIEEIDREPDLADLRRDPAYRVIVGKR